MAVLPEYRKSMVMALMAMKLKQVEWVKNCDSAMGDTSEKSVYLAEAYEKLGFQIVDMVSWESTNYYSYVFRKANKGMVFSDRYARFRFTISRIKVKLLFTENGKPRLKGLKK